MRYEDDVALVRKVLDEELRPFEREAFEGMLAKLLLDIRTGGMPPCLTERQRTWLRDVGRRVGADVDNVMAKWKAGQIPRGDEVPTPDVLKRENLPMKPPGRS